ELRLVETKLGAGSVFVLTIPYSWPAALGERMISSPRNGRARLGTDNAELVGKKILVVEDSADNRILIRRMLELGGMNVELAENGRDGVDRALAESYDIVLMDIQMPEMDGYQAIVELRRKGYTGSVVALTAHAMKGEREACLSYGF